MVGKKGGANVGSGDPTLEQGSLFSVSCRGKAEEVSLLVAVSGSHRQGWDQM